MAFLRILLDRWLWAALLASAAMLAAAHAFERFGGLPPCILCLDQREVYWVAGTVAIVGIAAHFTPLKARFDRLFFAALAATFLFGLGVAVRHVGVEYDWWEGPAACAAGRGGVTAQSMSDLLRGGAIQMPSCEDALWHFLGLSMAGWNAVISLGLVVLSVMAAARRPRVAHG